MDSKNNLNKRLCTCIRYSIIEVTPSFLYHKVPIIYFFNLFIYWILSFFIFFKNLFKSFKNLRTFNYIKSFFLKKQTFRTKTSETGCNNYNFNIYNLLKNIDAINDIPSSYIYKKEVESFYKKDAIKKIKEVEDKYNVNYKINYQKKTIIFKKEIFYISKDLDKFCDKVFFSIVYNEAAVLTFKILKKIKILEKSHEI